MNKRTFLLIAVFIGGTLAAWSVPTAKPLATPPAPAKPPVPAYKTYTYYGERYRDPFIPLIGDSRGSSEIDDRPPQPQTLMLKGIVQDAKGRMALLTSGVSSYILRGGRLYDVRNRMVKKISGVIKAESVVLIGSDRTVRELRLNKPVW